MDYSYGMSSIIENHALRQEKNTHECRNKLDMIIQASEHTGSLIISTAATLVPELFHLRN